MLKKSSKLTEGLASTLESSTMCIMDMFYEYRSQADLVFPWTKLKDGGKLEQMNQLIQQQYD